LRLSIRSPPLFVITKQLDCTLDNLFYKILEERGHIREGIIQVLKTHCTEDSWAQALVTGLLNDELHLFMQFSLQTMLAMEALNQEL